MKNIYLLIIIFSFGLSACKEDITASWLKIDSVSLTTNAVVEGENSHGINDVWVYMDNEALGVFEVPCEIPILEEGTHTFLFYAGVNQNGINATKIRYPYYNGVEVELTLAKDQTITYNPNFSYKSGVAFVGKEDFEDTGIILKNDDAEDTTGIRIISKNNYPEIVKYGNNCGHFKIDNADTIAQIFSDIGLALPKADIYMELDYMNTNSFAQGMITSQGVQDAYLAFNGQEEETMVWKKAYISIGAQTNPITYSTTYDYYFVTSLDDGNVKGDIYIDNVKLLYFE